MSTYLSPLQGLARIVTALGSYADEEFEPFELLREYGEAADPAALNMLLGKLQRYMTADDLLDRPELVRPLIEVLCHLINPGGYSQVDLEVIRVGYRFLGILAPHAKQLGELPSASHLFDSIQQRSLSFRHSSTFDPLPSLRRFVTINLSEMPASTTLGFFYDGAAYASGYQEMREKLKIFHFGDDEKFSANSDLFMNQALWSIYANGFASDTVPEELEADDLSPGLPWYHKLLAFCGLVQHLRDRSIFVHDAKQLDLLVVSQTLRAISEAYIRTDHASNARPILEQGALGLVELVVRRSKLMRDNTSIFNMSRTAPGNVDLELLRYNNMVLVLEDMVAAFKGRPSTDSPTIEQAVGDLQYSIARELAVKIANNPYLKSKPYGRRMALSLIDMAAPQFTEKEHFGGLDEAALKALASFAGVGTFKKNLLAYHPHLAGDAFIQDLGL